VQWDSNPSRSISLCKDRFWARSEGYSFRDDDNAREKMTARQAAETTVRRVDWKNEASDRSPASEIFSQPANQARACDGFAAARICVARNETTEDGETTAHASGDGHIGNQFWLVAEHGMKAGYVRNIEHDPHVRVKLREG